MAECCIDFFPYCRDSKFILIGFKEAPLCVTHFPTPPSKPGSRLWLEDGFSTTFLVENPGGTPMPFCIGAHTAIRCPLMEGERFEDYQLVFDQPEDADMLLLTPEGLLRSDGREPMLSGGKITLDYSVFQRLDTIIFQSLRSRRVELRHEESGVSLDFSQFPMVAFWTKPDGPFLCMEPWHGCAALDNESGRFEDKPHVITLAPGEKKELTYRFTLL